jgi:hypothetical protein
MTANDRFKPCSDAWLTIAKVNSSVSGTGDRVFFLGGDFVAKTKLST